MSDRSFGDYTNRSVVKNPLLSTAVTGLSIEDLTQNAVLLPAVPSQELITRQDEQKETQMRSLWHSEHDITILSSGDTNSNQTQQQNIQSNITYPINNNKHSQNDIVNEMQTVSKASVKTTDDFDVNEYFARLHGTRYVSAPLNSNVPDQNASLQVEENLEEINLNESIDADKEHGTDNVQQSITADIAQNFSQLPNVLPHVASAVFSSFSNMLSLKSREVTPDEPKVLNDGQHSAAVGVPLGVPEPPVSVAPPLREPPTTGTTSNYRITTKKKVYAQVPGLSSGDNQHMQTLNPGPSSQNPPSYFTPNADIAYHESSIKNVTIGCDIRSSIADKSFVATEDVSLYKIPETTAETTEDKFNATAAIAAPLSTDTNIFGATKCDQGVTGNAFSTTEIISNEAEDRFNLLNPTAVVPKEQMVESLANLHCPTIPDLATANQFGERQVNANSGQLEQYNFPSQPSSTGNWFNPVNDSRYTEMPPQGSAAVIPPPPMFSNVPRRDSQTTVGKAVLPPSVARRISANHPIIKPQALPMMVPQDKIFTPTVPCEPDSCSQQNLASSEYAQHLTTDKSEPLPLINQQNPLPSGNNLQSLFQKPLNSLNPVMSSSNTTLPGTLPGLPPFEDVGSEGSSFSSQGFAPPSKIVQQPIGTHGTDVKSEFNAQPSFPKTTDNAQQFRGGVVVPPMFFNPTLTQSTTPKATDEILINKEAVPQDTFQQFMTYAQPEATKEIPEPPKISGNLNYRLTKKKPQYYSGPIEGVGNISNNVKPVLNPIGPSLFQGAIFTPEQNVEAPNQKLTTDYLPSTHETARPFNLPNPPPDSSSFQGAYFTPDHSLQPSNQKISSIYGLPSAYEVAPSFDLNQPTSLSYPIDLNEPEERKPLIYNDFNTAFDLSRPTTETFEDTPQEPKGFGIIGSLKSKLSSIDINKIQNTVTTFFDPAYNDTKVEEAKQETLTPYNTDLSIGNYQNFPQTENPSLEVYIPSVNYEQGKPNVHPHHADSSQQTLQSQYYQTQECLNQAQIHPSSNYTGWNSICHQLPLSGATSIFPIVDNVMQDSHRNEPMAFTGDQEVYPNTEMFSQDRIVKKATEKPFKETENEKIANLSKSTNFTPLNTPFQITSSENKMETNTEKIYTPLSNKDQTDPQIAADSSSKTFVDFSNEQAQGILDTNIAKSSVTGSLASVFDIKQPVTQPIMKSEADAHNPNLSITKSFAEESPQASRLFSNISAKDFFDRELTTHEHNTDQKGHSGYGLLQKPSDITSKSYFDYPFTNSDCEITNNKALHSVFSKESTTDFDTSKEILTTVVLPVLKNISDDLVPPQYLDNDKEIISSTGFDSEIIGDIAKPDTNAFTLFNFEQSVNTSIIPGCAPNKDIKDIEEKLKNVALIENSENISDQISGFFVKSEPNDTNKGLLDQPDPDLNICETCREIAQPEEKDGDDLTTHLIENITAPIQLANPVEHPVVETGLLTDKSDISYIAEGIIETMKLPAPVELIDDIIINAGIDYGWSTNEPHSCNVLRDHNYGFQSDAHSLGFFDDKTLLFENIPTNASDEIKAEYRISQEDIAVLPPINMSIAPHEEDTKSDESGLDVQSIEQDAKKDFPIYEEFVLDPSETDDNKIEYKERERNSNDPIPDADTFTNRVERYKKLEINPEPSDHLFELRRDSIPFELPTSTSPALTIASYFDTGNYAVENHYRNSLTSPSTFSSFTLNSTTPMRIPPGFEEEYKRRLSIAASSILPGLNSQNVAYIPDASTQNPSIITLTINPNIAYVPDTSTQIRGLVLGYPGPSPPTEELNISDAEVKTMVAKISSATNERLPAFSSIVEPKEEPVKDQTLEESIGRDPPKLEQPKLETQTDPINFFSSNAESTEDSDAYNNYSRLSSYFSSPPKPDHTKSFFELSQSQDHYRHKTRNKTYDSIQNNVENFFKTTPLNTHTHTDKSHLDTNVNTSNIPHKYIENMSLVHDLATCKNFAPKDDVVRTVNYFTVQNVENAKENSIGEPKNTTHLANKDRVDIKENDEPKNNELGDIVNSVNIEDIVRNCKYCCGTTKKFTRVDFDSFKVKKVMDRDTDTKKEGDRNMDERKEKKRMSVNFADQTFQEDSSDEIVSITENRSSSDYAPVKYHWFYRVDFEDKSMWRGFSAGDSKALEDAYNSPDLNENTIVATDGGRFDVNIMGRLRTAVYWTDKPTKVMRCSWFYKGTAVPRYVPYTEAVAEKLEEMYRHSVTTGEWHRRLTLPNEEMVVMHGPSVMVHFLQTTTDTFASAPSMRQRVVRGCVESEIEDTEPSSIDHLLLMCHGVGSACDMRFRSVEEVVDDFRSTSLQLVQAHYKNSYDSGLVGRVEVLPISWHSSLHSGETGVDKRLAAVTLESIPRLRNFTNDTLLDVLFYTSPVFCQTIIDTVCRELNRIYALFKQRNPNYEGGVSLGGHSLGSVILYDLLCHQTPKDADRQVSTDKHYVTGTAGTGQPCVKYPHLDFDPDALYALGSPIAIFECIRGVQTLGQDFCLPTCKNFFNIFHPYDPIAYRLEPMINPQLRDVKPYLIPHHKGRKRMHLELKDTMARVGADLKQKLIESIKSTWSSMWRTQPPPDTQLEKVVEEEIEKEQLNAECKEDQTQDQEITSEMLGKLNGGRRVDHVLQEAPFEMINEYLFAMSSHVCYWESEDTMLVMLREIYNAIGVIPDCSVPQHTLTVHRSRMQEDSDGLTYPDSPSTSRGTS